jgi:hypothetical protein
MYSVTVDGKYLKSGSQRFLLRGFNLWSPEVFEDYRQAHSLEVFQRVKDWGFNVISIITPWTWIEPYEDQVGVYDEENLQDMEQIIEWCADTGLYVIISIRIIGMWWASSWDDQEYTLQWVQTREAQNRYQNMLSMVVQRFNEYDNLIGFNGWFFPFHGYEGKWYDPAWEDCYYNIYTPMIVNTIRQYSNKIIFYSPCYQGGTPDDDPTFPDGITRDTGQFAKIQPLADNNVVYCHRLHKGIGVETGSYEGVEHGDNWDYDYGFMEKQIQPAIDFMNNYNVPLCAIEFGLIHNFGPITQSRLDCQDYKFKLMHDTGSYHWIYWQFGNGESPFTDASKTTLNAVGEQVVRWAQATT